MGNRKGYRIPTICCRICGRRLGKNNIKRHETKCLSEISKHQITAPENEKTVIGLLLITEFDKDRILAALTHGNKPPKASEYEAALAQFDSILVVYNTWLEVLKGERKLQYNSDIGTFDFPKHEKQTPNYSGNRNGSRSKIMEEGELDWDAMFTESRNAP